MRSTRLYWAAPLAHRTLVAGAGFSSLTRVELGPPALEQGVLASGPLGTSPRIESSEVVAKAREHLKLMLSLPKSFSYNSWTINRTHCTSKSTRSGVEPCVSQAIASVRK